MRNNVCERCAMISLEQRGATVGYVGVLVADPCVV